MAVASVVDFVAALQSLPLLTAEQRNHLPYLQQHFSDLEVLGKELVRRGWLTTFQAKQIAAGKGSDLVLDQYVLLTVLGEGSMGIVYKAQEQGADRRVALKEMKSDLLTDAITVARFLREAELGPRLFHPNVINVYNRNQVNGRHFLVMELIDGTDLAHLMEIENRLPIHEACGYVRQAAFGLEHLHQAGLVHRDIKPANLMLTKQGVVKVMDFGLARPDRAVAGASDSYQITDTGDGLGTWAYMAPEQMESARDVDIRADIYSLGCTLYHLLAGGAFPHFNHQFQEPKAIERQRADLPSGLGKVVRRMMAKEPKDRYQTPGEVASALGPYIATGGALPEAGEGRVPQEVLLPCPEVSTQTTAAETPDVRQTASTHSTAPAPRAASGRRRITVLSIVVVLLGFGLGYFLLFCSNEPLDTGPGFDPLPDKDYLTNSIGIVLVKIPEGIFKIGSPPQETDRDTDEDQHDVEITRPFRLSIFPITQKQYWKVTKTNPSHFSAGGGGNKKVQGMNTDHFPVERVSWQDAKAFCDALSALPEEKKQGHTYRLPTEAEWEYACRSNAKEYFPFHYGNSLTSDLANFKGNKPYPETANKGPALNRTTTVGSYKLNAFGLYDMHGNVWQWCADWHGPYDPVQRKDPTGPLKGTARTICAAVPGSAMARTAARRIAARTTPPPACTIPASASYVRFPLRPADCDPGRNRLHFQPCRIKTERDEITVPLPGSGRPVSQEGSVSRWLGRLQEGDPAAAQQLFQRYFLRLVKLARKQLRRVARRAADEEDVALSAFNSFCHNAERGHFPQLHDRDDLWRVLAVITARKVNHLVRDENRQKRGGAAHDARAIPEVDPETLLAQVCSREPSPELAAQMTEEYERLLRLLPDDLRRLAQWRMEGHTVKEVAAKLGCAARTVKRKLQVIRILWESERPA